MTPLEIGLAVALVIVLVLLACRRLYVNDLASHNLTLSAENEGLYRRLARKITREAKLEALLIRHVPDWENMLADDGDSGVVQLCEEHCDRK